MRFVLPFFLVFAVPSLLGAEDETAKLPVPDKASQDESLEFIKGLYDADYADAKTSEQKNNLAKQLLATGNIEKRNVVGRFVLFSEAARLAAEAGDLELSFQAVEKKAKGYQVDGLHEKAEILNAVIGTLRRPQDHEALAEPIARLITAAIDSDRYDIAKRVGGLAYVSARKAKNFEGMRNARARINELSKKEKAFKGANTALAILETNPADPDANLIVGKFRCFVKGDWETGLSMLALGSSESLSKLAVKELKGANNVNSQLELGNAWWDLAKTESHYAGQLGERAVYWYHQALPRMEKGLESKIVSERIEEWKQRHKKAEKKTPQVGTEVVIHWSMADDMDVYLNGKPLRHYQPSFRQRPDEANQRFSAKAKLKSGDVFTVGGRRGGSWGGVLVVVDKKGRVIWTTNTRNWVAYIPADPNLWFRPEVASRSQKSPVSANDNPWPPQKKIIREFGDQVKSIWHTPDKKFAFLYSVVQ